MTEIADIDALIREAGSRSLAVVAFEVPRARDQFVLAASGLPAVAGAADFLETAFATGPGGLLEGALAGPCLVLRLLPGSGAIVTTAERAADLVRALEEAWWERTARAGSLAAVWEPCLPEELGGELCENRGLPGATPDPVLLAFTGGGVRSRFQSLMDRLCVRLEARAAEVCGPAHDRVAGFLVRCACCGRAPVEAGGPAAEPSLCAGCQRRMDWARAGSRAQLLEAIAARSNAGENPDANTTGFLALKLAGAEAQERLMVDASSLTALGRAWRRVPGLVVPEELAAGGLRMTTGPHETVWAGEAGWCLAWLAQAGLLLFGGGELPAALGPGGVRLGVGLVLAPGSLGASQAIGHALELAATAGRVRPDCRGPAGLEFQRLGDGACLSERGGSARRWAGSSRELVALARAAGCSGAVGGMTPSGPEGSPDA